MNCVDAERLFDAYLDGELGGSLRFEFDAHRLRCPLCQQKLAMVEACEHIISRDRKQPALTDDFTDRVMQQLGAVHASRQLARRRRWVAIGGTGVSAAAVIALFAFWMRSPAEPPSGLPVAAPGSERLDEAYASRDRYEMFKYISDGIDEIRAAHANLASDVRVLPRLALGANLPEGLDAAPVNPWNELLRAVLPGAGDAAEAPAEVSTPAASGAHPL